MRDKKILLGLDNIRDVIDHSEMPLLAEKTLDFLEYRGLSHKYSRNAETGRTYINSILPSFPGKSWDRFFRGVERIGNGERVPLWLDVAVTGRCHCDCWHCFRSSYEKDADLDLGSMGGLILDAHGLGAVMLGITGGEPMLHPGLPDMIGMVPEDMEVLLFSTGHGMSGEFVEKIEGSRVTRCIISLDHYSPDIINQRRNFGSAYDEVMDALGLLGRSLVFTAVSICMTDDLCSEDALRKYMDLACRLSIDEIRVILPVPQGKLEGGEFKRTYVKAGRVVRKVKEDTVGDDSVPGILFLPEFESSACFGCGAGSHYISVNSDGQVAPCVAVPLGLGSIHDTGLKDIYSAMGACFSSPGATCLGRQLGKVMRREGYSPEAHPYPRKDSWRLASLCAGRSNRADLFRHLNGGVRDGHE